MTVQIAAAASLAAMLLVSPAAAQTTTDAAAHTGIVLTPLGALPSVVRMERAADSAVRLEAQLRYGRWKSASVASVYFNNIAATAFFRVTRRLKIGGTFGRHSCTTCDAVTLAGADAEALLWEQPVQRGAGYLSVGAHASAGMGTAATSDLKARSLGLLLPISVTLPQEHGGLVSVAFVPGIGYGYLTDPGGGALGDPTDDGGTRPIVGAAFSYLFPFALGVHASVHRVLLKSSPTHFGVAGSWRVGAPRAR